MNGKSANPVELELTLALSPGEKAGVRAGDITVLPGPLTLDSNY